MYSHVHVSQQMQIRIYMASQQKVAGFSYHHDAGIAKNSFYNVFHVIPQFIPTCIADYV